MTWFRNKTSRADVNCSVPLIQHKQQIQQRKTKFRSRSDDAVIRVYDDAGNVIERHEHEGDFKVMSGLLQRDFAHELGADDLANIEAFHLYRLLLIGCAHHFSGDRIELFARVILRGHVLRFHHH
jgi:hypothetical protein